MPARCAEAYSFHAADPRRIQHILHPPAGRRSDDGDDDASDLEGFVKGPGEAESPDKAGPDGSEEEDMRPRRPGAREGRIFRRKKSKQEAECSACPRIDDDLADVFLEPVEAPASSIAPERRRLLKKSKM